MYYVIFCFVAPLPPINSITVNDSEVCSNDFTVSWTSTSNDGGLPYSVMISPSLSGQIIAPTMDNLFNFTELTPNTNYNVSVATVGTMQCLGTPTTIMITTATREASVPRSELSCCVWIHTYVHFMVVT